MTEPRFEREGGAAAAVTLADTQEAVDLEVRAAWHYYIEGLTQDAVALALRVSRAKVVRLLVAARANGVVAIRVSGKAASLVALERHLAARFGLREAIVVAAPDAEPGLGDTVGAAAGRWLEARLRDGATIGVGWGTTLSAMADALAARRCTGVSVVSLLGGMTHSRAVNPAAVARRMADALGAECYQLTAPLLVRGATRAALWAEPGLRELRQLARAADIALLSVGDVSAAATLFREGLLTRADLAGLRRAGAVADVLCHFVDAQGRGVDHPVNRQTVAVAPEDLRRVGTVALVSGGLRKVAALSAALRALPVHVLVTDEAAATGLMAR